MKLNNLTGLFVSMTLGMSLLGTSVQAERGSNGYRDNGAQAALDSETQEMMNAKDAMDMYEAAPLDNEVPAGRKKKKSKKKRKDILKGAEGFIAGPDWEFDGFVAGGQGQSIKSMFVTNDLLYLNVGYFQGIEPGDRVGIYKRGERIRDPQTGHFLGYEVRLVGVSEITDKVEDETCSARVISTNDGVEIGDLVRME